MLSIDVILHQILTDLPLDTPKTAEELCNIIGSKRMEKPNRREFQAALDNIRGAFPNLISGNFGYMKTNSYIKKLRHNNRVRRHIEKERRKIVALI